MNRSILVVAAALAACGQDLTPGDFTVIPPNPPDLSTPTITDRFVQSPYAAIDILWVIDDSCSMAEEQEALVDQFPAFMPYLAESGLDWHVGVVSTSYGNPSDRGLLQRGWEARWITPETAEPDEEFAQMSSLGTLGSDQERGRDQVRAMWELATSENPTPNSGFFRDEAAFSVIVLSDEDDASTIESRSAFAQWMLALKPDPARVSFSSLVGPAGGCSGEGGEAMAGTDYLAITEAVGGVSASICDLDWTDTLDQIGAQATGISREFALSDLPDPESLRVSIQTDGQTDQVSAYEYDRVANVVILEAAPPPFAVVEVRYEVLGP